MKLMTLFGTRPEIIRLSRVINKLDNHCDQVLVHTGQNYDPRLSDIFLQQLEVRKPDHYLGVRGETFGKLIGQIISTAEKILREVKPEKLLVLGDTYSSLSSIVAKQMGIPVYHMESGNRCYDDRVPEEVNRRIIDHCSDILMPYTERSRSNLLREGIPSKRIFVTGNPIYEVLLHYDTSIQKSDILKNLDIEPKHYILVTMHRTENVDVEERLVKLTNGLNLVQRRYGCPVIVSTHPHTQKRLESFGIKNSNDKIRFLPPFGFFDYVSLERDALCVLTDSGTAQEECCIFGVPNVTIRDTTERPETVECGSNILSGVEPETLLNAVELVLDSPCDWTPPREYLEKDVSTTVAKIVVGLHGSNQLQNISD